jgi:hypothetical protein
MAKRLNAKKIIKANPSVNATQLKETLKIIEELREAGVSMSSHYRLILPFSKRVSKSEDNRTIPLSRRRD